MSSLDLIIVGAAVFAGFFVQMLVGFAATMVALPLMLLVMDVQDAIAFLTLYFLVFSGILVPKTWKDIDKRIVLELGIGVVVGLIIGIYMLSIGDPMVLKRLLGIFVLIYVTYTYFKERPIKLFKGAELLFGTFSGFFSGLFAAGGSIIVAYIHNKGRSKNVMRATIIGTLAVTNVIRVPIMIYNDLLPLEIVKQSLYVLPIFVIALISGHYVHNYINENLFKKIILVLLAISGILLVVS